MYHLQEWQMDGLTMRAVSQIDVDLAARNQKK